MTSGLSGRGPGGPVLIKGAGDIATGIACRLWAAGFSLVMTDLPQPTAIRRTVAFASAVYHGEFTVEGITARHVRLSEVARVLDGDGVAVVTDDWATVCRELRPPVIVDAVLAKRNTGTFRGQAGLVIAVGPGFCAGQDVDLVVESQRGHWLGRVICSGRAADNTGVPGII
ncbi:MAG: molybdenum hydroxylase, partial [Negativicutes bacterium]|nr:molybdenum hydroxylase [Negativicutes bacterium]